MRNEPPRKKTRGRVVWYDPRRGYGFIRVGGVDVYVNASSVRDLFFIKAGDEVELEVGKGRRGPYARNVRRVRRRRPPGR